MKITDIKMMDPLYVPMAPEQDAINVVIHTVSRVTFLQVFTDERVTGISPSLGNRALNQVTLEGWLKPYLVGEDPLDTERIWDKMYWTTLQNGRRGAVIEAISALDNALWERRIWDTWSPSSFQRKPKISPARPIILMGACLCKTNRPLKHCMNHPSCDVFRIWRQIIDENFRRVSMRHLS